MKVLLVTFDLLAYVYSQQGMSHYIYIAMRETASFYLAESQWIRARCLHHALFEPHIYLVC